MTLWARFAKQFLQFRDAAFSRKYLLYTNLGISIGLSMVGDALEQSYERMTDQIENWDRVRTTRMGISGLTVGLVCHYWYQHLDYLIPKRTLKTVFYKIVLDQTICSPFYISVFFLTMGILEKKSWEEVKEEIKDKAVTLYIAEWTVWPTAQFINFFFIKPQYRLLYDSTISLGYDIYTSNVKYKKKRKPDSNDTQAKQTRFFLADQSIDDVQKV